MLLLHAHKQRCTAASLTAPWHRPARWQGSLRVLLVTRRKQGMRRWAC